MVLGKIASIASGKPLSPSTQQIRMSLTPRCLSSDEHLHPELRALGLLEPQAEHVAVALEGDPEREVARAALHAPAVADLEHQRVEEDHRIDILKRPGGPRACVVHDRVGDLRDQLPADLHAVNLFQVRLDIPHREPAAVQRQDLVVEPLKAALALANDLRCEAAVAIPRRLDRHLPVLGHQRLRAGPVARVARPARRLLMRLIAQMVSQLDLHRPLHQSLGQRRQQPARPGDLLLGPRAGQQLIDHLIRDPLATGPLNHPTQSRAVHGGIHPRPAQGPELLAPPRGAPSARLAARRRRHTVQDQSLTRRTSLWLKA